MVCAGSSVAQSIIAMVSTAIIVKILWQAKQHVKDVMVKGTAADAFQEISRAVLIISVIHAVAQLTALVA